MITRKPEPLPRTSKIVYVIDKNTNEFVLAPPIEDKPKMEPKTMWSDSPTIEKRLKEHTNVNDLKRTSFILNVDNVDNVPYKKKRKSIIKRKYCQKYINVLFPM